MYNTECGGYGSHNYTLEQCRQGLEKDVAEFGKQYSLLSKAREMLDTQEHQELVRSWFDLYMQIIDEDSYLALGEKMEELETSILRAWYTRRNA